MQAQSIVIKAARKADKQLGGSTGRFLVETIASLVDGISLTSKPPVGCHKVYNIYAKKVGDTYHLVMEIETEPEP